MRRGPTLCPRKAFKWDAVHLHLHLSPNGSEQLWTLVHSFEGIWSVFTISGVRQHLGFLHVEAQTLNGEISGNIMAVAQRPAPGCLRLVCLH